MKIRLSQRIASVAPSATLAVTARAKAMREQGIDVINFGLGEPDFDTPEHIKAAAAAALAAGDTKYPTPVSGKNPLRDAVCSYFRTWCGLEYGRDQVHVTVGAKDALLQAMLVLLDPGDEVIIPVPYWVSYPEQVRLAGARPVLVETFHGNGHLAADKLAAAITPRTRMVILNSPSNPTGAMFSRAELEGLAGVLRERDILVLSDELYHRLLVSDVPHTSFATLPGMFERTITVNGVSKTYAMTGWRLGFVGGPAPVIKAMSTLQGQTTSGAVSFVQTAAVAALTGPQDSVDRMCVEYRQRAARMYELLLTIPGVECERPAGGFVMFPHVGPVLARMGLRSGDELAALILEKSHVAIVSGSAFGAPDHIRLSFATGMAQIEEGMRRIVKLLA